MRDMDGLFLHTVGSGGNDLIGVPLLADKMSA